MAATSPSFTPDLRPPRLRDSMLELSRFIAEFSTGTLLAPLLKTLPRGDGHTIMTLPGFMGADGSTSRLRKMLNELGYKAVPWGLGRNASEVRSQNIDDFLAQYGMYVLLILFVAGGAFLGSIFAPFYEAADRAWESPRRCRCWKRWVGRCWGRR